MTFSVTAHMFPFLLVVFFQIALLYFSTSVFHRVNIKVDGWRLALFTFSCVLVLILQVSSGGITGNLGLWKARKAKQRGGGAAPCSRVGLPQQSLDEIQKCVCCAALTGSVLIRIFCPRSFDFDTNPESRSDTLTFFQNSYCSMNVITFMTSSY